MKRATERVTKALKELKKYYEVTECYVGGSRVDCREIIKQYVGSDGRLETDVKVCNKRVGKCVEFRKGDVVKVIEAEGSEVYLTKDEAEAVKAGERLGYQITGKGEARSVRSSVAGDILYIEEVLGSKHDHYRIYIVERGKR